MRLLTVINQSDEWARWIKPGETVYYLISSYEEKDIPKQAGFGWSPVKKVWYTADRDKAAKLAEYAFSTDLREDLMSLKCHQTTSLAASRAETTTTILPSPEGLEYMPFQAAGIEYAIQRRGTLIADDPGLGKTIQVLGYINCKPEIKTVIVICPNTIKNNWKNEAQKWLMREFRIGIGDTKFCPTPEDGCNFLIVNYDAVKKLEIQNKIANIKWDLFVIDEAHYYKNTKTVGYQSIAGVEDKKKFKKIEFENAILTTGTPIENFVHEIWPLISFLDPDRWNKRTFWYFHKRFCNAKSNGYSMDFKGANEERLPELQKLLRETVMVRRLKSEVLKELPDRVRSVIELDYDDGDIVAINAIEEGKKYQDKINSVEDEINSELIKCIDNESEYKIAVEKLEESQKYKFEEISKIRIETARAKIPYVIKFIEDQLESLDKIIIGCWHQEIAEKISNNWPLESISITGNTLVDDRQSMVDRFQSDPTCRLAVLTKAGYEGITLTAASTVNVIELPWKPSQLDQLESRAHRIGQKDCVNVNHLVLRESIDVKMAKTIVEKQNVIDKALNKKEESEVRTTVATRSLTREKIIEEANNLTPEIILSIHAALRYLANDDSDYARGINGIGYNKIDTGIGHQLADCPRLTAKQAALGKKVIKKYARQLPKELYLSIFGGNNGK